MFPTTILILSPGGFVLFFIAQVLWGAFDNNEKVAPERKPQTPAERVAEGKFQAILFGGLLALLAVCDFFGH